MTDDMKKLFTCAMRNCKHYDVKHNTVSGIMTINVWVSKWMYVSFTTYKGLDEGTVMVRYFKQCKSYFSPTPMLTKLDKLCGKSTRKYFYAYIPIDRACTIMRRLEQYASSETKFVYYADCPEEVI